jgi:hypothetical protein
MSRKPGNYVEYTIFGLRKLGRTYNSEEPINGKTIVHLVDNNLHPILVDGKQVKRLVSPENLKVIGFAD